MAGQNAWNLKTNIANPSAQGFGPGRGTGHHDSRFGGEASWRGSADKRFGNLGETTETKSSGKETLQKRRPITV
jgi:hypothetical protein